MSCEMENKMTFSERVVGLDILRAIAILSVMYGHAGLSLPLHLRKAYYAFSPIIDGVSLFFVLSGFLIGGILLRMIQSANMTWRGLLNFWIRRWFRTIPNYVLILLIVIVIEQEYHAWVIGYFVFAQNLLTPHPQFFQEAWSLSVEEWFYLIFPLCVLLFCKVLKKKEHSIPLSAAIFLIVPTLLRIFRHYSCATPYDIDEEMRKIVIYRLDSIMYGIIAVYVSQNWNTHWIKYRYRCLFVSLAVTFYVQLWRWGYVHLGIPLFFNVESISVMFLLPFFSEIGTTRIAALDSLAVFISKISYSMYLTNLTLVQVFILGKLKWVLGLNTLLGEHLFLWRYPAFWICSIGLSWVLYEWYERRMTALRERFAPRL